MEPDAMLSDPKHEDQVEAMRTESADNVSSQYPNQNLPVGLEMDSLQESDRGFHGGRKNDGVDFDTERVHVQDSLTSAEPNGAQEQILNDPSSNGKNKSTEMEEIIDNDSQIEPNADASEETMKSEVVEDFDAEKIIKNQKMYCLYCPCCGQDITKTVKLVKRSEIRLKDKTENNPKGKDKVNPNPAPPSVWKGLQWLLRIFTTSFRYFVALLFLYIFAIWFLFISPKELPSSSSINFFAIFALLFFAILVLWLHFNPDSHQATGSDQASEASRDLEPLVTADSGIDTMTIKPKPEISIKVNKLEILKSVVYGGLMESITSLGIVSSAAGSGASTVNIMVMGLANLSSGITLILHNIVELKNEKSRRTEADGKEEDRYEEMLGRREKFKLHVFIVISSFIIFGLIPPLVYGFSFHRTDKRRHKAAAALAVSLLCVVSLAIAKAYVSTTREYFKTGFRYTKLAIGASGISYVVGDFVNGLLERYGLYEDGVAEGQRR